ncbi:MAG: ligand-binding sensor domain-containing protein [bacterium]
MMGKMRVLSSPKSLFSVLTVCLLMTCSVYGLNPEQKISRFTAECFDSSTGLPQNTVADIIQNKAGYIMLATQEGLVRYDGRKFSMEGKNGLLNSLSRNITKIFEAGSGNIVFSTAAGIAGIEENRVLFENLFIKDFVYDKNGNLWVGTYNSGIIKVAKDGSKTFFTKENEKINSNIINSLFVSSKGELYVATLEGLSLFKEDKFVALEELFAFAYKMAEDKNGWIWVATERGLALVKENKLDYIYTSEDGLKDESLRSVFADSSGSVWIGSERGNLTRFYKGKFSEFLKTDGKTGAIISIFEDREGSLWFGTEATGACIVRDGTVFQAGINSGNIRSLSETTEGEIWAATFGEGIKILRKDETISSVTTKDGLRSDSISVIYADTQSRIWIGTRRNGVQIFQNDRFYDIDAFGESFSEAHPISPTVFFEDSRGNMWIADRHSHRPVFKWSRGQMTSYEITKEELSILDIAENSKGVVHFLSLKGGLFTFDANSDEFTNIPVHSDAKMTSLFFDKQDWLWITTLSQGIILKTDSREIELNESNGLYNNTIHSILQDSGGSYWFSTNKGIFTVKSDDLNNFINGKVRELSYRLFKEEDGMLAGECNGGSQPSAIKSSDGTLWFPTIKGVVSIDPSKIEERVDLPPVAVVNAVLDNLKTVDLSGKSLVSVPAGTKNILINFTSLYFSHPAKVRFQYMLKGFDNQWSKATAERSVNYTNISPGIYKFAVKAYLADSPESFSETAVSLEIKPFFYQDSRFKAIAAAVLLFMIFAAYSLKIRIHKLREKELKKIVDERTEELVKVNEKLRESILKDPMTELCNRRYLFEIEQPRYERMLFGLKKNLYDENGNFVKPEKVTGLFLIDISGLKKINEKKGYDFGDKLLKAFAQTLKNSVRKDDLVVRWGGDEFLVILNSTDYDHLSVYAKKVLSTGLEGIEIEGEEPMKIVVSIGYSAMPFYQGEHNLNFEENLLMSDMALFKALAQGHGFIKQAVPGNFVPDKAQIESFMKDIDEGIESGFFNIVDI